MGGLFCFFTGLLSLGASAGIAFKEQSDIDRQNMEYLQGNYSYAVQSDYDFNRGKLYAAYDLDRVVEAIKADYPRMTDYNAWEVAEAAVAKKMMEEQTNYKYKLSENCKFFDLDKYAKDEFKRKEGEWM